MVMEVLEDTEAGKILKQLFAIFSTYLSNFLDLAAVMVVSADTAVSVDTAAGMNSKKIITSSQT